VLDATLSHEVSHQINSVWLLRRRYEKGHWDAVITNYKEVELADGSMNAPRIPEIFERTRRLLEINHLEYQPVKWLPCHGIDLKKDGELKAHVDSVKFSGDLVAGISLSSSCVMRLAPHVDGEEGVMEGHVDLFLPPLSLYVLTGVARYRYSHELLNTATAFRAPDGSCISVHRDHRISIIFRDAKPAL
jgi:alkylated DNA repair protein alkB family protein 7